MNGITNWIVNIIFGIITFCFLVSCTEKDRHEEGEKLAKVHCASCHTYPAPLTLPRRIWGEMILPNMGLKMGMSHGPIYSYENSGTQINLDPMLTQEEWDKIVHYYLNKSSNDYSQRSVKNLEISSLFKTHLFSYDSLSVISMTFYDSKKQKVFLGNASSSELLTADNEGRMLNTEKLESPPVKIAFKDSLDYILTIGSMNPSDVANGKLKIGSKSIDSLRRPVDFLIHDINSDGYDDVFVCNYGNNIGDFSLFENLKNGTYSKKIIHPLSGAIKVQMANMDDDDEDEIVVLFAQEHEYIMIWDYENNNFSGQKVVQFQPAFGSVDFQLRDMNGDGLKDIIIGNGDNSDLSTVLKNFHGVRVLLNKGNKRFTEDYFYPIHGVSKVVVEDFNSDGDNDIVAISNFGNFTDSNFKSVQLLLNEGELKFTPKSINGLPDFRWQTIDVKDYDNDGDLDLFLGAFNLDIGPKESSISSNQNISWVRLENTLH